MEKVYSVPSTKHEVVGGFCPGCLHGVVVKLVCEVQEELGILDRTVCVIGVGCCCITARHWKCDVMNAPHGRAPAVATGLKRMAPKDTVVYTYQGDGQQLDLRQDRRPDGSDHAGGHEGHHRSLRP